MKTETTRGTCVECGDKHARGQKTGDVVWCLDCQAELKEEEFAKLKEEVDDWRASAKKAASEECGDEVHCTCVGVLRRQAEYWEGRFDKMHHGVCQFMSFFIDEFASNEEDEAQLERQEKEEEE